MALGIFAPFSRDRRLVDFAGAHAGIGPLTWGQKAILQDMRDSGNQFTMGGRLDLPAGHTIEDVAGLLSRFVSRHAALRMRLTADDSGQEVAESGQIELEILTVPDEVDRAGAKQLAAQLMDDWPCERFDFHRDLPFRMAVLRHRGECVSLVWALSHLAADGGAHLLLLDDLLADLRGEPIRERTQLLDIARAEQEPHVRQNSARALKHWESQLKDVAAPTFGAPMPPEDVAAQRYWQARFTSPAAHLAVMCIARRTGTDLSRATLGVIAAAIGRATGVNPLTLKVMINNRFRQGFADVIAPVAQNSVITIDLSGTVDDVVGRARGASLTAGMRAYYDPDELGELMARVTLRVNDQRAMVMRADEQAEPGEITPDQIKQRLAETTLTWLGPRENMHEQANILIENRADAVSLHVMWDLWSLPETTVGALLRAVEEVAVEAAFDPHSPALPARS